MALEKQVVIDQITVDENNLINWREATTITDDGRELSKTFHRTLSVPGTDVATLPAKVAAIASTVWTPEVVAAYQAEQAAQEAARQADLAARNAAALNNMAPGAA